MNPLTDPQIRAAFVNAGKREVAQATLPDLESVRWERLEYLGWIDPKRPALAYVVVELDEGLIGMVLRAPSSRLRRPKAMCAWCQDVVAVDDVSLYAARRAGAAGRQGNTVGTLVCTDFRCSVNVRRRPTTAEAGGDDPVARQNVIDRRIAGLVERSRHFARQVLGEA